MKDPSRGLGHYICPFTSHHPQSRIINPHVHGIIEPLEELHGPSTVIGLWAFSGQGTHDSEQIFQEVSESRKMQNHYKALHDHHLGQGVNFAAGTRDTAHKAS